MFPLPFYLFTVVMNVFCVHYFMLIFAHTEESERAERLIVCSKWVLTAFCGGEHPLRTSPNIMTLAHVDYILDVKQRYASEDYQRARTHGLDADTARARDAID